ncbi:MAG: MbnP family copper-binding protein [Myxococcota bacterium]
MKTHPWLLIAALAIPVACDSGGGDGDTDGGSSTSTTTASTTASTTATTATSTTTTAGSTTDAPTTEADGSSTGEPGTGSSTGEGSGSTSTGEAIQEVSIQFAARVGDAEANCTDSYEGVGSNATGDESYTITFRDLRFYVSEIRLVNGAGEEVALELEQDGQWQVENVALLDFEDGSGACTSGTVETNTVVVGTVPADDYTGVLFQIGVPYDLNHTDVNTAEAPLNDIAMNWNWLNGRKFVKIDINTDNDVASGGSSAVDQWNVHLGSICGMENPMTPPESEDQCMRPGRPQVSLDAFDPTVDTIVADVAALLDGVNIAENVGANPGVVGCQSIPPADNDMFKGQQITDCDDLWANWGMDWATGDCEGSCEGQTFMSVQSK